jgi:pimeloyl-ACP methyl ester carboxylesterase
MKNLYLSLCLLALAGKAFAQIPSCNAPIPLSEEFSSMLKNLDKTQIPTGALYEKVFPWAEIEDYDGTANAPNSNYDHFTQAYSELYNSTFNTSGKIHPSDLENAVNNFHPDKEYHHPVGIIDYEYNTIKPDAVSNNLLSVSGNKLYDVAGRSQTPYITKKAQIGAILLNNEIDGLSPGTHYLHFKNDFFLSNHGVILGNYQTINIYRDGILIISQAINFATEVIIPIIVSVSSIPIVVSIVLVVGLVNVIYNVLTPKKDKFIPTPCGGADEINVVGNAYDGGYGKGAFSAKGKATIFYGKNNCSTKRITKPIIFVDGFDPTNAQHAGEIWTNYLNKPFDGSTGIVKLGDELIDNDYDIIIFDQSDTDVNTGGGGLIENNALALAKFLETLYSLHSSTLQNDFIVVGASMGGLISRYALTYMEKNNIPHHTKLFISFDAPHSGAQIPVGVQQFADVVTQYGGLRFKEKVRYAIHQSDAAKQLLLHHSGAESESVQAHPYRNMFLTHLNDLGSWPVLCRKIAIADGNRNGILKPNLPSPNPQAFAPINPCGQEIDFGITKRLNPSCSSPYCYKTQSQTFAQTESGRCPSMEFRVNNNTNLLQIIFGGGNFTTKSFSTLNANYTSFDAAPGARFGADPISSINNWIKTYSFIVFGNLKIGQNIISSNNFIPTFSSAAYTYPNNEVFSSYKGYQGINLSKCAGTTPMDTVYAPATDLNHVQINEQIAKWFKSEIYFPKPISTCGGNCPDYVNLSNPLPNGTVANYYAAKAIMLLPNFSATNGTVIKAQIGCGNAPMSVLDLGNSKNTGSKNNVLTTCPITWDVANNEVLCSPGFTTFNVFIKNIDISTYAEFSTNGVTWYKANLGNKGYSFVINANPGQSQNFYARAKNDPTNTIFGSLLHCN